MLPITLNRIKLAGNKQHHRVRLVKALHMMCNMTLTLTLTWGQIFKLTFRGQKIYHSNRLNERNNIFRLHFSVLLMVKKLLAKNFSLLPRVIDIWWPLEPKPLTWGQIWGHTTERAFQEESNPFFRFVLPIIVPEIWLVFWSTAFRVKNRLTTQLCDVTMTWPDLGYTQNFACICARCSFEAMQSFASLSRRDLELVTKNKRGG